jgi:hypothetical protein
MATNTTPVNIAVITLTDEQIKALPTTGYTNTLKVIVTYCILTV